GTTYTPADVAADTSVTIRYTIAANGSCAATTSDVTFTVNPFAGTASNTTSTTAICENTTKALSATPAGGSWSVVSGGGSISGTTYTPADVAADTSVTIRYTIAANGSCAATTSDVTFTVNPFTGTASNTTSTTAICENTTKALSATPAGGSWSVVSGGGSISGTTYTPADVSADTSVTIRYTIAANGSCAATTSDVIFTVNPFTGTASNTTAATAICENTTKALSATPAGGSWSVVSGGGSISGTTYTPADVSADTSVTIRYTIAANGSCAATTSDVTFTVNPFTGTASNTTSTTAICENTTKALSATPAGGSWSVVSGGGSISGTTYTPADVSADTSVTIRYTIAANGSCAATTSDVTFTVNPTSIGGIIGGSTTVCTGTNSTLLTLSGHTGSVIRWESSLDNFATVATPIANTTNTLTTNNLTATTSYRAIVQSGVCAALNSAAATVTVNPFPSFSISNATALEGNNAVFNIDLSTPTCNDVEITITTSNGTAGASDYTTVNTTVTIPAGSTNITVNVPTTVDTISEPNETFAIEATVTSGNTTNSAANGTGTITDSNGIPTVSLSGTTSIAENAAGSATITATLSTATTTDTVVSLGFSGTAGSADYAASNTTITIPAGQLTGTITIDPTDDVLYEGNETVIIDITNVTGGNGATENGVQQATVTITDDETTPTVTLSGTTSIAENAAGTATITATLSTASTTDTVVSLGFSGTASGADYAASNTTITIPAGQLTGTITIDPTDDALYEGNETVIIDITNVTGGNGATENGVQQATVTITDNETTPTVSLSGTTSIAENAAGTATITATLSTASTTDTVVSLGFSGTASGADYAASNTT
ncbi:beta strand repeat-containing protein, partial [Flavobacterium ajazii]|uniref:beta strand repeat-containing protein n=1 Tax=Flavobacterium ajazii TaxID=2692318 RepID=UPI0013D770DC